MINEHTKNIKKVEFLYIELIEFYYLIKFNFFNFIDMLKKLFGVKWYHHHLHLFFQ